VDVVNAFAGNDTVALKGQPLQLAGVGNGAFRWSPAAGLSSPSVASPVATLTTDQTYVLTVTNSQGCTASDTLNIRVFDRSDIFVPSAFTPNGDGKNDVLHLVTPGFRQLLYFRIYNRWGQVLFETSSGSQGWNGRWHNQPLPPAVYIWMAAGTGDDGRRYEKKGTVLLLR
ncbi:MAG TPA: gliding motility-associated C-terminal domain-containing protein, partial [Flavisolibacter sp.]|nr:gliding motility-associated C-terminal domain-containing protein [Flavisolibacter sp.]